MGFIQNIIQIPFNPTIFTRNNGLERHSIVFIKSFYGSRGKEIISINTHTDKKGYELVYMDKGLKNKNIHSVAELQEFLSSKLTFKKYVIQQGISLLRYNGRSTDIRVLNSNNIIIQKGISLIQIDYRNIDLRATVQRNGRGELDIVSLPVRMGCARSPITSTQSGSKVFEFHEFFKEEMKYSDEHINDLKNRIEEFLLISYRCIEASFGIFGEIDIDFAVDQQGDIWFIECNAKPGYDAMDKSYDKATIDRTFLNPLEYAKYITNYI